MPKSILARSERYQRRALYGVSILLSVAILLAAALFGLGALNQFHDQQISRFGQYREQVKSEADKLSARLMQFVDLYEGIWPLHNNDHIPFNAVRQGLHARHGAMVSGSDLTATPFSVITDLTADTDAAQLATLLRIVRDLSAAPAIDTRKLGINLSGYIYSRDQRFIAVAPQLSPEEMQRARTTAVSHFIAQKSARIENFLAPYSVAQLQTLRPFWTSLPGFGGADTITRIVLPMLRDGKQVATIVATVPEQQFFSVFMKNERIPGFFLLDNDTHEALGYDPGYQTDRRLFEAVRTETGRLTEVSSRLQTFRKGGVFFIVQKVDGPGWTAVLAFDWRDILRELQSVYIIGALLCLAVLVALWGGVIYFEYRIARPLRLSATRQMEVKQFNRAIIDTLPIGIAIYDQAARRVLLQNAVAVSMLGSQKNHDYAAFYETMSGREAAFSETSWALDDHRSTHLGVVRSKTRWSGRDVVLIGLVDINERIASERKLKAAVAEAERANRAKSMFLGLMSHEIRTPLHGAIGHLELLSHASLGTEERARVALINRSFEALLTLVNDILDITKIDAGALTLNLAPVRLSSLIERCAQNFSATICGKGLQFWCFNDRELDVQVLADEQRITQILQNLLSNASKFTKRGFVALSGICLAHDQQEIKVRLSVEDTGIGIPVEQQACIFKPLTQADDTISQRYGGTGLGLYLCRDLSALMGGSISIDSIPGSGSTFYVDLSLRIVAKPQTDKPMLEALSIDVICPVPAWKQVLLARIEAWGGTIHAADKNADRAPAIRLYASPHEVDLSTESHVPAPQSGTLYATPDGPLVPLREPDQEHLHLRLTSLSINALQAALSWCVNGKSDTGTSAPDIQHGASHLSALSVIVAEDDPISLTLIAQQLQELGISKLRTAVNGREALALWKQAPGDLLISDWQMPEFDGLALLHEIRRLDPAAKIVVTTALASADLATGKQDFNDVLHKPIRLADLQRMLAHVYVKSSADFVAESSAEAVSVADTQIDRKLFNLFFLTWDKEREALNDLFEQHDLNRLCRRLHRLQGALLAIGLNELATLNLQLQKTCKVAQWESIAPDYVRLMRKLDALVTHKGMAE